MVVRARTLKCHHPVRTVNRRQKSSWAWYSQKMPRWKAHPVRSSSNNQSDAATRVAKEQNEWNKPCAIQFKPTRSKSRRTLELLSKSTVFLLARLPRHAARQHMRVHKRQDSTTAYEKIRHVSYQSPILPVGEAVAQTTRSTGQHIGIGMARRRLAQMYSKTYEDLFGTPNGMVRRPCTESQSGKTTLGHHSLERHGLGAKETDTSHARKTTESSQRP